MGFVDRCERSISSLEAVDGVHLERRSAVFPAGQGNGVEGRLALLENDGISLPEAIRPYVFDVPELHASWQYSDPVIVGEFCLGNLPRRLAGGGVPMEDSRLPEAQQRILAELKLIDQAPFSGSGRIAGLRIPQEGEWEIWYYDMKKSYFGRLDLDYGCYLENVLLTRGAFGWQYLFSEEDMRAGKYRSVTKNLTSMLNTFAALFPDQDYTALADRLEARL
ncbi:hypothetical protein IEJ02_07795 [Streptomyces sp. 5-10]|nr:hypothetical protein [Streptomyces sp. 5-10]